MTPDSSPGFFIRLCKFSDVQQNLTLLDNRFRRINSSILQQASLHEGPCRLVGRCIEQFGADPGCDFRFQKVIDEGVGQFRVARTFRDAEAVDAYDRSVRGNLIANGWLLAAQLIGLSLGRQARPASRVVPVAVECVVARLADPIQYCSPSLLRREAIGL